MVYIGCHLPISGGFLKMINLALKIKVNTFAFFLRNPRSFTMKSFDEDDFQKFLLVLNNNNFGKLIAHAPYILNLSSKDKEKRKLFQHIIEEDIQKMEYLPYNYYNIHPGAHVGQGIDYGIKLISESLNNILKKNQKTIVLLETMTGKGTEVGGKFEELRKIIDNIELKDKIGVCLDTCHVSDAGYDIKNDLEGLLKNFNEIIGLKYLKGIHINDSKNELGSKKDRHELIGKGFLGINTFKNILNNKKFDNLPFILETPISNIEEGIEEIKIVKSLLI